MKANQFTDPIKDLAESGKLAGLLLILSTVLSISLANSVRAEHAPHNIHTHVSD